MNLEDHIGDIIRKSRNTAGISAAATARAADLTPGELAQLEETGEVSRPMKFDALGGLLGLNPGRLEAVARGWLPRSQELGRWRHLRQITTTQGGNCVNCFLIWDEHTREAALFDTGWEAGPITQRVHEERLTLKHLFITHGHHDHIAAMETLLERCPGMRMHNAPQGPAPRHHGHPETEVVIGTLRIEARRVPGHAEDGTIYVASGWPSGAPHVAFVGDTVFAGSLARGFVSAAVLRQKVQEQIFTLPQETLLCPGHGPVTTVGEEMAHNPFF
jgi:hydroxyacylglutathione hydrolase